MTEWREYQEQVAQFFRTLGLSAATDVSVRGVRTDHDVDVLVRSKHAGFEVTWIVECKAWKSAVPKEKVLALRTIVDDVGADRGFIMAEHGYQSGALEAARLTNIMLTSLGDLKETLAYELAMSQLKALLLRALAYRTRYWSIPKDDRIEHGLRPEAPESGYSGQLVIVAVLQTIEDAILGGFPMRYDPTQAALSAFGGPARMDLESGGATVINTPAELVSLLNADISELERRFDIAEQALKTKKHHPAK